MRSTEGGIIQVTFLSFETENNYDFLYVYDGTSTSAQPIGQGHSGGDSPQTVTATNPQGALTFRFTSDSSVNKEGWVAHVTCIGVGQPLEITASLDFETINIGETNTLHVNADGGLGNYTYSWSPADNLDDPTSQNPVFTATEAGDFTYTVTVSDGIETASASVSFTVLDNTNVNEIEGGAVSVYPNPASSILTIEGLREFSDLDVKIVNIQGQVVRESVNSLEINVSNIEAGIYFIKIECDGQQYLKKFVIK